MPKFLHTADLHINALRRFSAYYIGRMERCLDSIQRIAASHDVDFIVVAGDIYDRRDITHIERMLLSSWLSRCNVPVVMLSGNHDKRSVDVGDTCLGYLSALSPHFGKHIIYDGIPKVVKKFGCYLVLLPYQGWMDQELFLILQGCLSQCSDRSLPIIVVLHEAVHGNKTDVGLTITKSNQIRLDDAFPAVTYWALGDIHLCQQVGSRAWYSGAPHQTRFDELPNKGVLIVDTDDPENPEFVPVPSIPLQVITEEPTEWPSASEALVQYKPSDPYNEKLPPNVELHPSVMSLRLAQVEDGSNRIDMVGVFDGLDAVLARAGLRPDLFPLAWEIAANMAKQLGINVEIPKRHRGTEDDG